MEAGQIKIYQLGKGGKLPQRHGHECVVLAYYPATHTTRVKFMDDFDTVVAADFLVNRGVAEFVAPPRTLAEAVDLPKMPARKPALPTDSAERKRWPLFSGLLRYFPAALARVSHHSFLGNEKHNPGQRLNHARGKSGDHEDCIVRHLVDASEHPAGSAPRLEELSALAWRALALLQEECELAGHRPAPGATFDKEHNGTAIR